VGYRSDVVIAIYADVFPEPDENEISAEDLQFINEARRKSHIGSREVAVFEFNSVKWYSEYAVVQFFNKRMDQLDDIVAMDLEHIEPYAFVRVGEEVDDIETRGATEDMGIYPEVTIHNDL
jgi:hypothetical protein